MSNINFQGIDQNFPIAGQDNDTQTFRDNFDTIKNSLRIAKDEITALEDPATGAARLDRDNDFNLKVIQRAVLQNNREQKFFKEAVVPEIGADPSAQIPIDYENGSYQIFTIGNAVNFVFQNLPGDSQLNEDPPIGVGKITLELYSSDGNPKAVTFATTDGTVIKRSPNFPSTATGAGFITTTVTSQDDPIFIEVWRHSLNRIFMRYLGPAANTTSKFPIVRAEILDADEISSLNVNPDNKPAPSTAKGIAGDRKGDIRFDNNYIYYCTANWVNASPNPQPDIWKRSELTTW